MGYSSRRLKNDDQSNRWLEQVLNKEKATRLAEEIPAEYFSEEFRQGILNDQGEREESQNSPTRCQVIVNDENNEAIGLINVRESNSTETREHTIIELSGIWLTDAAFQPESSTILQPVQEAIADNMNYLLNLFNSSGYTHIIVALPPNSYQESLFRLNFDQITTDNLSELSGLSNRFNVRDETIYEGEREVIIYGAYIGPETSEENSEDKGENDSDGSQEEFLSASTSLTNNDTTPPINETKGGANEAEEAFVSLTIDSSALGGAAALTHTDL